MAALSAHYRDDAAQRACRVYVALFFRFLPGSRRLCTLVGRCHLRRETHRAERYEEWFGRRTVCRGTDKFVARNTKPQGQEGRRVNGARWAATAPHRTRARVAKWRHIQPRPASNRGCRYQAIGAVHEPSCRPYQQREPRSSESTQQRLSARRYSNLWVKKGHVRSLLTPLF